MIEPWTEDEARKRQMRQDEITQTKRDEQDKIRLEAEQNMNKNMRHKLDYETRRKKKI